MNMSISFRTARWRSNHQDLPKYHLRVKPLLPACARQSSGEDATPIPGGQPFRSERAPGGKQGVSDANIREDGGPNTSFLRMIIGNVRADYGPDIVEGSNEGGLEWNRVPSIYVRPSHLTYPHGRSTYGRLAFYHMEACLLRSNLSCGI
jgi:hypothetical protein